MNMQPNRIIGIHGAPRSGTSWLGQLFNSNEHVAYRYQPFFSYAFRDRIDSTSSDFDIRQWFDQLLDTNDAFINQTGDARLSPDAPTFFKNKTTHLVYKEVRFHHLIENLLQALPNSKYIGIIRDPRAVLGSWCAAPREFNPKWSIIDEWRLAELKNIEQKYNWYGYERWKQLTFFFMKLADKHCEQFRIVRYEHLLESPGHTLGELFDFCELTTTKQSENFLKQSMSMDDGQPYGVFRKKREPGIRKYLPKGIEKEIERDLEGSNLEQFLWNTMD